MLVSADAKKPNPIQSQNKPNFKKAKMNVRLYVIEDYRKNDDFAEKKQTQFKPKTNPIFPKITTANRKLQIGCDIPFLAFHRSGKSL